MVWYLAGSLAVHLGAWAVLEAAPPEEPIFDVEWVSDDRWDPYVDIIPREFPESSSLDLEHCDVRSDNWAGCVLGTWSSGVPVEGTRARSDDRVGCLLGAPLSLSDDLMGPGPRDLNNSLYGLDGPCSVGPFGDHTPCGFPVTGPDPKLGFEFRGPRYRFAYHERPSRPSVVRMARGGVMSSPGYDRSIVRRYLRRHLGEIGACYEAQQLAHPDRAGDVAMAFFISPTGEVPASSGSGFDAGIAGCVANVVKTITFPRPLDGEGVQVNYSFHFQAPRE
jgi:hypothetical protein